MTQPTRLKARGMILAAGFGSRLGALGKARPKPMLPVCGAPLVQWVLEWMRQYGVEEFVINLHHHGEQIEAALGDGAKLGVKIHYSKEDPIQGTGGGILQAREFLDRADGVPIVVANGKLIQDIQLDELLAHHAKTKAPATMVLRRDHEGIWGEGVGYDQARSVVTELLGVPSPTKQSSDLSAMFCGVHVLSPDFLDRIPSRGAPCIVRSAYAEYFEQTGRVDALVHPGYWWEHSTPERYQQGVARVLTGDIDPRWSPHPVCQIHPSAHIAPGACVHPQCWIGPGVIVESGARLGPGCQVLDHATIGADAALERCVVLERAQVRGSHQDEVIA